MRATQILRSSFDPKNGVYMGSWGHFGSQPQRGTLTYALSANRQRPFAGAAHAAVFNTLRRTRNQILYWAPWFALAYVTMDWATKKNEWLNSKEGRLAEGEEA